MFYEVGTQEFGINWPEKYYEWFSAEDIGTDFDTLLEVFRRCHSKEYVDKQVPFEGAAEVLRGIVQDYPEAEIAYVSDRSEKLRDPLYAWLEREGFLTDSEQHVAVTNDKREWMREVKPAIVIDDRVRTMLMARFELGAQVVSIKCPHNLSLVNEADAFGIYVVPTWKDIDRVLREKAIPAAQGQEIVLNERGIVR